jgi:hypothetical protein
MADGRIWDVLLQAPGVTVGLGSGWEAGLNGNRGGESIGLTSDDRWDGVKRPGSLHAAGCVGPGGAVTRELGT